MGEIQRRCHSTIAGCQSEGASSAEVNVANCPNQAPAETQGILADAKAAVGNVVQKGLEFGGDAIAGTVGWVVKIIAKFIFWIAGILLATAGNILDLAIAKSITSGLIGNLSTVDVGWRMVRDFCNMAFIFVLLYVAIATILDIGVNTKRTLVNVIIAGLLINFSLFFGKVIIDFGNVLATQVWSEMKVQSGGISISSAALPFVDGSKIQTTLDPQSDANKTRNANATQFQMAWMYLMGAAVTFVLAYCYMFGAGIMAYRMVRLMMLLIFSPFAFLGLILPKWSYFHEWLDDIIEQSVVAPVFLFMLYLGILVINSSDLNTLSSAQGTGFAAASTDISESAIFFNLLIIILIFLGSISVAQKVSNKAASFASKWAKGSSAMGGAAVIAGGAFAGRQVGRRVGKMVSESETLNKLANSRKANTGFKTLDKYIDKSKDAVVRGTKSTAAGMQTGSWDVRRAKIGDYAIGAAATGMLASQTGINVSKPPATLGMLGEHKNLMEKQAEKEKKDKDKLAAISAEAQVLHKGDIERQQEYIKDRLSGKSKADSGVRLVDTPEVKKHLDKLKEEEIQKVKDKAVALYANDTAQQIAYIEKNLGMTTKEKKVATGFDRAGNVTYTTVKTRERLADQPDVKKKIKDLRTKQDKERATQQISDMDQIITGSASIQGVNPAVAVRYAQLKTRASIRGLDATETPKLPTQKLIDNADVLSIKQLQAIAAHEDANPATIAQIRNKINPSNQASATPTHKNQ
jgi:hypothetical protein